MKRLLFAAILLGASLAAHSQQISGNATVTWTLPTTNTDGTAIPATGATALTKVQIFAETATIPNNFAGAPKTEVGPGAVTGQVTMTVSNNTTVYIRVKVYNIAVCSDFSNEATKLITIPKPGVPTTVTFTVVIVP